MIEKLERTRKDIELLSYIEIMEILCVPDLENYEYPGNVYNVQASEEQKHASLERLLGETDCMMIFRERYNQGHLKSLSYEKYMRNKDVKQYLAHLELDRDKFWFLTLFLYDFYTCMFIKGRTMKDNPLEQLEKLLEIIKGHADSMTLNIKAGKTKVLLDDPHALHFMAEAINKSLKGADAETIRYLSRRIEAKEKVVACSSAIRAFFTHNMLKFFDYQPQIRAKRRKDANHSKEEYNLICRLIYLSGLTKNDEYLYSDSGDDSLKPFLKQYKDYKYPKNVSCSYPEFII